MAHGKFGTSFLFSSPSNRYSLEAGRVTCFPICSSIQNLKESESKEPEEIPESWLELHFRIRKTDSEGTALAVHSLGHYYGSLYSIGSESSPSRRSLNSISKPGIQAKVSP